jgi:hypothetical protein
MKSISGKAYSVMAAFPSAGNMNFIFCSGMLKVLFLRTCIRFFWSIWKKIIRVKMKRVYKIPIPVNHEIAVLDLASSRPVHSVRQASPLSRAGRPIHSGRQAGVHSVRLASPLPKKLAANVYDLAVVFTFFTP